MRCAAMLAWAQVLLLTVRGVGVGVGAARCMSQLGAVGGNLSDYGKLGTGWGGDEELHGLRCT